MDQFNSKNRAYLGSDRWSIFYFQNSGKRFNYNKDFFGVFVEYPSVTYSNSWPKRLELVEKLNVRLEVH